MVHLLEARILNLSLVPGKRTFKERIETFYLIFVCKKLFVSIFIGKLNEFNCHFFLEVNHYEAKLFTG